MTPAPVSSTTPATSQPGMTGKTASMTASRYPAWIFQSTGLTDAAFTRTSTVSTPSFGFGTSPYSRTSGPP